MRKKQVLLFLSLFFLAQQSLWAEDGYRLWLRYDQISNPAMLNVYRQNIKGWMIGGESPTLAAAAAELQQGLQGLLGKAIPMANQPGGKGIVLAGLFGKLPTPDGLDLTSELEKIGDEGYLILSTRVNRAPAIVIMANTDVGVLYGVFHFLRLLQTQQDIRALSVKSQPRTQIRMLNHWDNLDRTVERGYAGFSLWDWHKLPDYIDPRYIDYARANASIGINGTALTNVNANALVLTPHYLEKVKALADVFRPYGIKVYLTARFSAPIEIGGLQTADPRDESVRQWWRDKATEIYHYVPDFGGFLVKANSEGQPGPQNYGRTHAEGANLLADAVAPHGGVVVWRAFVYDNNVPDDRHKQAYGEFKPLDGSFRSNVLVQVKNGAIDFQPREPFHPLFGAMPQTPLMMEFQITQEYLGFATHLVYLGTLFEECLDADTYAQGKGSTVGKVVEGSLDGHTRSGMAGVANIGTDRNWCGHHFAQSNWYSYGRLAWDHELSAASIAEEWIRMTFTNAPSDVKLIQNIMMGSRETTVKYMTPLGLHHIMGRGHHYGPGPWVSGGRADWTSLYYHRADTLGIGFDRTASGSNALEQYQPMVQAQLVDPKTCPEAYLLWFHHLPWDFRLASGQTLWEAICQHYYQGVEEVRQMQRTWASLQGRIDAERFDHVRMFLQIQEKEAVLWRNACVLYFQTFSRRPIPVPLEKPEGTLEYYEKLSFPYAPGIRPRW